jgi:hypothetical protein
MHTGPHRPHIGPHIKPKSHINIIYNSKYGPTIVYTHVCPHEPYFKTQILCISSCTYSLIMTVHHDHFPSPFLLTHRVLILTKEERTSLTSNPHFLFISDNRIGWIMTSYDRIGWARVASLTRTANESSSSEPGLVQTWLMKIRAESSSWNASS